jgi:hypothetical protein
VPTTYSSALVCSVLIAAPLRVCAILLEGYKKNEKKISELEEG